MEFVAGLITGFLLFFGFYTLQKDKSPSKEDPKKNEKNPQNIMSEVDIQKFAIAMHEYQKSKRPNRIILVRHGNSKANEDVTLYQRLADNKIGLTEKGKIQALEAGKKIKEIIGNESIRFYVSPYKRTRQTYNCIKEALVRNNHLATFDNRIREQEYGNLQGEDMQRQFEAMKKVGEFYYRFENGESGADVFNRACLFMEHIFREMTRFDYAKRDNIIIVTHDLFIRVFILNFLNLDVSLLKIIRHPKNCEAIIIEKQPNGRFGIVSDIYVQQETDKLQPVNQSLSLTRKKTFKDVADKITQRDLDEEGDKENDENAFKNEEDSED